jgi:hypothetical protein
MIPHQRDPVTLAARLYRAVHDDSRSEKDSAAAADPMAAARATTAIPDRVTTETARML